MRHKAAVGERRYRQPAVVRVERYSQHGGVSLGVQAGRNMGRQEDGRRVQSQEENGRQGDRDCRGI